MLDKIIECYLPKLKKDSCIHSFLKHVLGMITGISKFNRLIASLTQLSPWGCVTELFQKLKLDYSVVNLNCDSIPTSGSLIIVANHPSGLADGLLILNLVGSVRRDIKVVMHGMIMDSLPPTLRSFILPFTSNIEKPAAQHREILRTLMNGNVVVIFAAGFVSDLTHNGIVDRKWNPGFLRLAQRTNAPILPVLIDTRNSFLFYVIHHISLDMSFLLLMREMFRQARRKSVIFVGDLIPVNAYNTTSLTTEQTASMIRKYLYQLKQRIPSPFWVSAGSSK